MGERHLLPEEFGEGACEIPPCPEVAVTHHESVARKKPISASERSVGSAAIFCNSFG